MNDAVDKGADVASKAAGKAAGVAAAPAGPVASKAAEKAVTKVTKPLFKIVILIILGIFLFSIFFVSQLFVVMQTQQASASCAVMGSGTYVPGKASPNMSIVKIIVDVGRQMGKNENQILTALAISKLESGPRNLYNTNVPGSDKYPNDGAGHDHTSLGAFQQLSGGDGRDGKPWGTDAQLMDPAWAAKRFYENLQVVDPSGSMSPGEAGYATQRPADKSAYIRIVNDNVATARTWLAQAGTTGPATTDAAPASLDQTKAGNEAARAQSGWVRPVATKYPVTSGLGARNAPTAGASTDHKGADIGTPIGTEVHAANAGTVTVAGVQGGYGNVIYIEHGKDAQCQSIQTRYGHLSSLKVQVGQTVTSNQLIALSGNTGRSTGPHLHFEVRINENAVDPIKHLTNAGAVDGSSGAACSPVDGSLTDPGVGPRSAEHHNLTPRAYNVRQLVDSKWGCQAKNNQQPCISTIGGYDPNHAPGSDHITGNAVDIMVNTAGKFPDAGQKALGDEIDSFLRTNAKSLGINYLIWYGGIWSSSRAGEGTRPYSSSQYDIKSATGGHFDHVHVSVNTN